MKQKDNQREMFVEIKKGKEKEVLRSWQYYSIVNVVRQFGMNRTEADDVARWARTAKSGDVWNNAMMSIVVFECNG